MVNIKIEYYKEGKRKRYVAFCPLCKKGNSIKIDGTSLELVRDSMLSHLKQSHKITKDINFKVVKSSPEEVQER